ncbi:hypothetical protein BVU17_12440 [Haloarcula taiwanensis]|uniref:Uncharacterized protein n=1 Tax=Haloarcula taiwanensis TaxID=1932004 RepID=A0A2H5A0P6_9EURY|nr:MULTISPECIES: hypothetical protein [Haloarcula]AUG48291.1 hypothetical protein BVU17_12440 [Haloarcula taiwanensis]RLM39648.1 hypothetical protein DVK01_03550 [Haloarcula sp. Atlit-120R]
MTDIKTIFSGIVLALLIMSAGCSTFVGGSGPTQETASPTQTPERITKTTETTTSVTTEINSTPVATEKSKVETESPSRDELSKAEKFKKFDQNMQRIYRELDYNRSAKTETFPENNSYHMTIQMRDTTNRSKTVDDRLDPLWNYYVIVEDYNDNDDSYSERDHTYIPDTVNVTFVTEDGGVFETTYIKYNWAYKYYTDEWSIRVLMAKYGSTTEEGPAYHENGR